LTGAPLGHILALLANILLGWNDWLAMDMVYLIWPLNQRRREKF